MEGALPQTGTAATLWMVIGAVLLMIALIARRMA
jgi:LPXTG-motif cell wall-anchored protein